MAEYISMDCLWKCETCFHHRNGKCAPEVWCENGESYRPDYSVLQFSAIEAEPVRHGKWEYRAVDTPNLGRRYEMYCTACGKTPDPQKWYDYCPMCGTKMNKEELQ